jgi:long-subunit acyl-CoA synthetase (AMP-forming)
LKGLRLKLDGSHAHLTLRQQLREQITPTRCVGYGTTETGAISFTDPDDLESGETIGQPLAGIEVTLRNSDKPLVESA